MFDIESFCYSFDLNLLALSTGHPHPLASYPIIQLCASRCVVIQPSAEIQILGDYIVVLLPDVYASMGDGSDDELYIVNWKTGLRTLVRVFFC